MAIDLHVHSTASDGTLSPGELVKYARQKNLEAIALTDHDTVEGIEEALGAAGQIGLELIPGIEISAEYPRGTLHILGYFVDHKDRTFLHNLSILQNARSERNPKIALKLQQIGFDIDFKDVQAESGNGLVGRPHFAQVLLKKGYVKTTQEAFDKYLTKGAPAYVEKYRFQVKDAIKYILYAKGIPVLAHPFTLNCQSREEFESLVKTWIGFGLQGIEVYYSDHNENQTTLYREIAEQTGLLITGGSDFHGVNLKGIDLGLGKGNLAIPYKILEVLKEKRRGVI